MKDLKVNGWKIVYNDFWKIYQCNWDGVIYAEFREKSDAIAYCKHSRAD